MNTDKQSSGRSDKIRTFVCCGRFSTLRSAKRAAESFKPRNPSPHSFSAPAYSMYYKGKAIK